MEMSGTPKTYYVDNIRFIGAAQVAGRKSNGKKTISATAPTGNEAEPGSVPREFALLQNYPNPFNPTTTIRYELPFESHVVLKIYDMTGSEVRSLVDKEAGSGSHSILWDGKDGTGISVASGTYICRMTAVPAAGETGQEFSSTRKLMLMK
jgi:hypothetical protein